MLRSMLIAALMAGSAAIAAQGRNGRSFDTEFGRPAADWCEDAERWNARQRLACDVREESLAGVSAVDIDTGGNGGIRVRGASRATPRIRFRVLARAGTEADARALLREIEISTSGGRVRARGPRAGAREGWSVDVELESPPDLPLTLTTRNGGITVDDTTGRLRFETTNGGVSLANVAGDVGGGTVNGGLTVALEGRRWNGTGLDVHTTNGGVRMTLPRDYSAELTAETRNGGVNIDFPVVVQGRLSGRSRRVVTTLGSGGAPLHVRTTNGGISITRR